MKTSSIDSIKIVSFIGAHPLLVVVATLGFATAFTLALFAMA
ncbi:hypothetical protein [Bradyrhizobium barranii]|nr:hypothetical protein [Bradyrhizobium japonicum]